LWFSCQEFINIVYLLLYYDCNKTCHAFIVVFFWVKFKFEFEIKVWMFIINNYIHGGYPSLKLVPLSKVKHCCWYKRRVQQKSWSGLSVWFGLVYGVQRHFQQYFSYIVAVSFIVGGSRSTRSKPPTCRKSLTNFII